MPLKGLLRGLVVQLTSFFNQHGVSYPSQPVRPILVMRNTNTVINLYHVSDFTRPRQPPTQEVNASDCLFNEPLIQKVDIDYWAGQIVVTHILHFYQNKLHLKQVK